ncbi:hypothetical protein GCM10025780_06200 [Frondihabitans cladoniiphilus]|uniref:Uncharacterized protein n=1 Tax=Frondihabitans cladoniiphilus TaxID=715785 RepID=A0ABP8VM77_9MICO
MPIRFTTSRLLKKLENLGISHELYSLGEQMDDSLCLLPLPTGEWETFIGERGEKTDRRVWPDEEAACFGFLGRLAWTQWQSEVPA